MIKERDREILNFLTTFRGLTISQANRLFFKSYNYAQKRLKQLEDENLIRSYFNKVLNEKVYILENKISTHDLLVIELYSRLIELGCKVIDIKTQYRCYKNQLRPDGFITFQYEDDIYFYFIEVIDTYSISMSKFQTYEMFFKTGEMQSICYGAFPGIIVLGFNPIQYESNNYDISYIDFKELKNSSFLAKLL